MLKSFVCHRLASQFKVEKGRRQFIVTGKIDDEYFIDFAHGVCDHIEDALLQFALRQGYNIAVAFDHLMTPKFALPEMESRFRNVVEGVSVDEQAPENSVAWEDEEPDHLNSPAPNTAPSTSETVSRATANSSTREKSAIDQVLHRLIPYEKKSFIVLKNPEQMFQYTPSGGLAPESQEKLQLILRWAKPPRFGNQDTCTILLVAEEFYDTFKNYSNLLDGGHKDRVKDVRIGPPDQNEIEALLTRIQCRYGLVGHPRIVARNVSAKKEAMYNIVSAIARKMRTPPYPSSLEELFEDGTEERKRQILHESLEKLNSMIGLDSVKEKVKELMALAKMQKRRHDLGEDTSSLSLHSFLLGNPGTGKTVVARILGQIYYALGLRSSQVFVEISASDITSEYNSGEASEKMRRDIQKAIGGVLFIDEVYQFAENPWLKQAFENVLMKTMEDHRDSLTVLAAGYREKLPDILKINPGVKSRFNHPTNTLVFEDYTAEELIQIADAMLKQKKHSLTPDARQKMVEYIHSRERLGGIENGRGVRNLVESIVINAGKNGQDQQIETNSIPEPVSLKEKQAQEILDEIDQKFVGLAKVKTYLKDQLIKQSDKIARKSFEHETHHLALLGHPGTGKTSLIGYMSKFFHAIGVTSQSKVVKCDARNDCSRVRDRFDEALGGVLFIDEAYRLAESHEGRETLNQIVEIMTEKRYRDLVVIIAGYPDKMQDVFRTNPGFADRFKKHIIFENLTILEAEQVFMNLLRQKKFRIDLEDSDFQAALHRELRRLARDPRFANARTVDKFFNEVSERRASRCSRDPDADRFMILSADVKSTLGGGESLDAILAELDANFVGLQSVKDRIRDLALSIEMDEKLGVVSESKHNMQFIGNPGTGKTTIARYMARVFNAIELVDGRDVIERAGATLKGSYVGHSKDNVLKLFEDARTQGKVIFIDEAYGLCPKNTRDQDSFASEVIATIVSEDTASYNERVYSILAGYPADMEYFLKSNPGLASRFPHVVEFPDYTTEECLTILRKHILERKKRRFDASEYEQIEKQLLAIISKMKLKPDFGNARDMRILGDKIIAKANLRGDVTITLKDIPDN